MKQIFISHATEDSDMAHKISDILRSLSSNSLTCWFTSDLQRNGGIKPGASWFNNILEHLEESDAVIVLLTPISYKNTWVTFECGFAKAIKKPVFPIRIGLNIKDIPAPMNQLQICSLTGRSDILSTFDKILDNFEMSYNHEIFESYLLDRFKNMDIRMAFDSTNDTSTLLNNFKVDVMNSISQIIGTQPLHRSNSINNGYDVLFYTSEDSAFESHISSYLNISAENTVSDILNDIYFLVYSNVTTYSYLKEWVLLEDTSNQPLIVKNCQDKIPASSIFTEGSKWRIELLKSPILKVDASLY